MDGRVRPNVQLIALLAGGVLFLVALVNLSADSLIISTLIVVAAAAFLFGLAGDRLIEFTSKVIGFKLLAPKVTSETKKAVEERPVVGKITGTGNIILSAPIVKGEGAAGGASARAEAYDATVVTKSFTADAVIAAADAMDRAKTPEELADGLVNYVRESDGASVVEYLASLSPANLDAFLLQFRERDANQAEDGD